MPPVVRAFHNPRAADNRATQVAHAPANPIPFLARAAARHRWRPATLLASFIALTDQSVAANSCAPRMFRWEEDCRSLRGQTLTGLDDLRFIPLNETASVWLTLGGEYRLKTETLDPADFGIRPTDRSYTATGQRFLLHADLRTESGFRTFVQLSAASDAGRKPIERPFDRSRTDVAQAFVDIPLPVLTSTVLRIGRQEIDSAGNRLISLREAANLRLAFDMAHLETNIDGISVVAFYGRPVLNRIGSFDDRGNPAETFLGGWISAPIPKTPSTVSLFYFSRDRKSAIYEQGTAADKRRTLGLRYFGNDPTWDYAIQAAYQYGDFGTAQIAASGIAGDVGWHPRVWGSPRIALSFGVASGDKRPNDKTLGTFDVLYPNLGYFTDAPVYYPGNTADTQPNVTLTLTPHLSVRTGSDFVFRVSKRDAVYAPPGIPLIRGDGTGPAFVAALTYLRADWTINPHVQLSVSGVHSSTGSLVERSGGHDFNYGALTLDLKE